jgi:hypothetical protein
VLPPTANAPTLAEVLPDGEFFGPELELALVDPETLSGTNKAFDVIKGAAEARDAPYTVDIELKGGPGHELHLSTVEYCAPDPVLLKDVWETCQALRLRAYDDARRAGALVMSVGTPFGAPFLEMAQWRNGALRHYLVT